MADKLREIIELLTCPVCLELYKDPYILPCPHVLCRSCIEGIKGTSNRFSCPECRHEINLDSSGIDGLERDRRTALLVEAAVREKEKQAIKREMKANICEEHNRPEEIYCKTCNILVCNKCGFDGSHNGHSMFEAEIAADKGKEWINDMLEQIKGYHADASKQIKQCENYTTAIKANASCLWNQMEQTFGKIRADLERREVELSNWLQEQVQTCDTINKNFISTFRENIERLNGFIQELQSSMKEEAITFIKSFGTTRKRVLDFLENEKNQKHPTCYPGDALSNIEFKYAPWRLHWPSNIEDITLEGSIKYQKEHTETREQTTDKQTTNLEVTEIQRRLLAKSKSVRTAMEKLLIEKNAKIEWPLDFKNDIKIINQEKQQRQTFKNDIVKMVSGFFRRYEVREIDFNEVGFKWVQWQVEYVEKEMQPMGDNFALMWTAYDVTVIGVPAKLNQLVSKLKGLMSSKK